MKLLNLVYDKDWITKDGELQKEEYSLANIVFLFGDTDYIKDENRFFELRNLFPNAKIVGCSSSGNIFNCAVNLLPPLLRVLTFGHEFNQVVDSLPPFLKVLTFGTNFNQELTNLPIFINKLFFKTKHHVTALISTTGTCSSRVFSWVSFVVLSCFILKFDIFINKLYGIILKWFCE